MPLLLSSSQFVLALTIFLGTFVYEDAATLLAASLAATGKLQPLTGVVSAALGIWVGDVLLYGVGTLLNRGTRHAGWLRRLATPERIERAREWFERRGATALIASRAVPGSRLPLYIVAGTIRYPLWRFAATTGVTALIWVSAIFIVTHQIGQALRVRIDGYGLFALAILLGLIVLLWKSIFPAALWVRGEVMLSLRRWSQWEFWPGWLFYPPVVAICIWHSLRYRGFGLPTIANPGFRNGGVVGESKIEILDGLARVAPEFTATALLIESGETGIRMSKLDAFCAHRSLTYPLVLKPNVGQRGEGFKLARSRVEAQAYLAAVSADVIAQQYVAGPEEAGVFYYRFPGQARGHIFAITRKVFPYVRGDGAQTVEELIRADSRAALIAGTYLRRLEGERNRVPASGELLRLVEAGNHCQGCIFEDGSHLRTAALEARIDEISRAIPEFFIGRYDIRYRSEEELKRGENFSIIELNGAASEATSIYDARNSLRSAYGTLYRQWQLVYAIGEENRQRGHRPASLPQVWHDWQNYRAISAAYPAAD